MDTLKIVLSIAVIIFLAVASFCIHGYFSKKNSARMRMYEQNALADSTKIERLKIDNEILYQRFANVLKLTDTLISNNVKILKERDEKILALSKAEIKIKELISEGNATTIDTVKKQLTFDIDNEIFKYHLFVDFPKRFHRLNYNVKPFNLEVYVTERKTDKIYGGYAVIMPIAFQGFVDISDMDVYIDESLISNPETPTFFKLGVAMGAIVSKESDFALGLASLLNEKHYFDAKYGFINKVVYVNYSFMFW